MDYQQQYEQYRAAVETYLENLFTGQRPYSALQEAMRYSLLAGGKRVRPVLALAFCDALGGRWQRALPFACALELIHTYSLIHDDLPCMDDDDLRRGKPTCHKVYGETMAVLAGDALQGEAFGLLAGAPDMSDQQRVEAVALLAAACAGDGMVAGQVLDTEGLCHDENEVRLLHSLKTGAMLQAACEMGCIAADGGEENRRRAAAYGAHLGMAFQIRDDMLDVIADEAEFGKPVGSDREEGKVTFVDLLGLERCEKLVEEETDMACRAVADLEKGGFLVGLARKMADRRK